MEGGARHSAHHRVRLFSDGWHAGAGLEVQVQHNTEHLHLFEKKKKRNSAPKTKKPEQIGTASVLCVLCVPALPL